MKAIPSDSQKSYSFHGHAIRVVLRDGEPWFVASDVAAALDYRDAEKASRSLPDHQKATTRIVGSTSGGNPNRTIVSEGGLYRLVLRSRKPEAESFTDWVTDEVLPTIRKSGSYNASTEVSTHAGTEVANTGIPDGYVLVDRLWLKDLQWGVVLLHRMKELVSRMKDRSLPTGQLDACLSHLGGHFIDGTRMILSDAGMDEEAAEVEKSFQIGFVQPY
ncbi:hypothetical protein D3C81_170370 [compost metagenome]